MIQMRLHPMYNKYITYYGDKSNFNKLSMYKISESSFNDFIVRYESDEKFAKRVDDIIKLKIRDLKIGYFDDI